VTAAHNRHSVKPAGQGKMTRGYFMNKTLLNIKIFLQKLWAQIAQFIKSIFSKLKVIFDKSDASTPTADPKTKFLQAFEQETKKYLMRFGLVILIAVPAVYFSQGENALRIIIYKAALAFFGVGCAELMWSCFFKPYYGRSEELNHEEMRSIMVFRGILYAAVILAFTLGL
jgi:hypothetical protein